MIYLAVSLAALAGVLIGAAVGICLCVWLDRRAMERRWRQAKRIETLVDATERIA